MDAETVTNPPEYLLKPEEVAQLLGVSPSWVRDHATRKRPRLPVLKIGKFLRFRREDLYCWIDDQARRVG